jgi:hypothetical protein
VSVKSGEVQSDPINALDTWSSWFRNLLAELITYLWRRAEPFATDLRLSLPQTSRPDATYQRGRRYPEHYR